MFEGSNGRPKTRYVETDLGYLGYQVFGEGDRDILFVTGAVSNIDALWDEPSAVRFFDRLSKMGRVIQYDMRGSGISDPIPGRSTWMTIEDTVDDLRAVLDAAGSAQPVVYGDTEGGLFSMMLAAVEPSRVSALILANSHARVLRDDDYPIGMPRGVADRLSQQYVDQHGTTGAMLELTAPSLADDARFRTWWTRYQRLSIPLGLVKTTFEWFRDVDVRAALPQIAAPTLVVSKRDARFHRLEYGQYLADRIPNAVLRVVEGADTLPFHAGDFGTILDHVEEFLSAETDVSSDDRVLATVMFTDIVSSTALASSMGDERWLDLLEAHNSVVRLQLERFRGHEVNETGDGFLATFDGPARAIRCAVAIREHLSAIGLKVRIGIHTGEVELRAGEVQGLGVHIASRVMQQSSGEGIVVSGTVKDLVVGSGFQFTPCGDVELRGVPGKWLLFELMALGSAR